MRILIDMDVEFHPNHDLNSDDALRVMTVYFEDMLDTEHEAITPEGGVYRFQVPSVKVQLVIKPSTPTPDHRNRDGS